MRIQLGFARWNSRVVFSTFLAVDAVCDGSRELSITFFSYSLAPGDYRSSETKGHSRKRSWTSCRLFLLKNGTELLERFLRNCNPTLTHVNSKSLIITVAHPENR